MPRRPTFVHIGPIRWRILFDKAKLDAARAQEEDQFILAWIDRGTGELIVDPSLSEEVQRTSLFHEMGHAAWWIASLGASAKEEPAVSAVTALLLDALTRPTNKPVRQWLLG